MTKVTLLALLAIIVVLIASGAAYRGYRHHALAEETAIDPIKGINEAFFTKIGGIDPWIAIRGQDRNNPVIPVPTRNDREALRELEANGPPPYDSIVKAMVHTKYFDSITAPHKELLLLQNAGHNAMATRSDEFLNLLVQRVRHLAVEQ